MHLRRGPCRCRAELFSEPNAERRTPNRDLDVRNAYTSHGAKPPTSVGVSPQAPLPLRRAVVPPVGRLAAHQKAYEEQGAHGVAEDRADEQQSAPRFVRLAGDIDPDEGPQRANPPGRWAGRPAADRSLTRRRTSASGGSAPSTIRSGRGRSASPRHRPRPRSEETGLPTARKQPRRRPRQARSRALLGASAIACRSSAHAALRGDYIGAVSFALIVMSHPRPLNGSD